MRRWGGRNRRANLADVSGIDMVFDRGRETDFFCCRYPRLRQSGTEAGTETGAATGAGNVTLRIVTSAGKEGECPCWVFFT